MFSKILVAVDGSEYADKALQQALDIALKYHSKLTLVHVVAKKVYAYGLPEGPVVLTSPEDLEKEGEKILRKSLETAKRLGVSADTKLIRGNPAEEILRLVDSEKFDLIVMGSRGLSGVSAFLLGSVSDKVSHHAKCPVLIIK